MAADLGFIDDTGKILQSHFFLSKVGGKPFWLDLKNLPATEELICTSCNSPLRFLCQLYCPQDDQECTFHRTLFIFMCLENKCFQPNSNRNFTVFRNQLPRNNPYYPDTPPPESFDEKDINSDSQWSVDITSEKFGTHTCILCGNRATSLDSKNSSLWFCCESHLRTYDQNNTVELYLLPEFGICIEPEYESDLESCSERSDSEQEEDKIDINVDFSNIASAQDDPSVEQIFSDCSNKVLDKIFTSFKSCIADNPDQVIRYGRKIKPLWLTNEHVPSGRDNIPSCEYCGAERQFEFQILPQLLNHLKLDNGSDYSAGILDWGTLVVYTCKDSCNVGPAYKKEFLWKQDLVS